ncbi:MAG TPA: FKBP-type peptidyl-prolyl cis-trans isomerase [Polyangiaceae bacterium]
MSLSRFGLLFVGVGMSVAFACGAPLEGRSASTSSSSKLASADPPASGSPLAPESSADPICGQGYKWQGSHCIAASLAEQQAATNPAGSSTGMAVTHSGPHVTIEEVKIGTGTEAHDGSRVKVHYVGRLQSDNSIFDSSRDRDQPFSFTIGLGEVIRGFDEGVTGMKVGGQRKVTIPSALGYGRRGAPPKIPPDATLIFELELLGVE